MGDSLNGSIVADVCPFYPVVVEIRPDWEEKLEKITFPSNDHDDRTEFIETQINQTSVWLSTHWCVIASQILSKLTNIRILQSCLHYNYLDSRLSGDYIAQNDWQSSAQQLSV